MGQNRTPRAVAVDSLADFRGGRQELQEYILSEDWECMGRPQLIPKESQEVVFDQQNLRGRIKGLRHHELNQAEKFRQQDQPDYQRPVDQGFSQPNVQL